MYFLLSCNIYYYEVNELRTTLLNSLKGDEEKPESNIWEENEP